MKKLHLTLIALMIMSLLLCSTAFAAKYVAGEATIAGNVVSEGNPDDELINDGEDDTFDEEDNSFDEEEAPSKTGDAAVIAIVIAGVVLAASVVLLRKRVNIKK